MAMTYRAWAENLAAEAARNTLQRAGHINPTTDQTRTAERCAMRHLLKHLARTDQQTLVALRDELRANATINA